MLAYDIRDDYEIINGKKFLWKNGNIKHALIDGSLFILFATYITKNRLGFVFNQLYVHLPDGNIICPDIIFVDKTQRNLVINNADKPFHGVPDMVAEIFSRSTMKRDVSIKKDIYERNGVKEYWIIDPWRETVDVYLLRNGKYELDGTYINYSEDELACLPEEERAEVKFEIPVAVLDGFKVKIKNIFGWFIE